MFTWKCSLLPLQWQLQKKDHKPEKIMFAYLINRVLRLVVPHTKVLLARSFLLSRNGNSLSLFSASVGFGSLTSARHPMSMSTSSVAVYFHQSLYLRSNTPPLHTNNKTALYKDEKDKT